MPTLLEGEALAVWLELEADDTATYAAAKKKMIANLAPMGFVSLDDFHKRKLRPGEALSMYVHDLKKLLSQAMPALAGEARDQLLIHQLLDGVPAAVSKQIRATGETAQLGKVVERARLLMTMENREQAAAIAAADSEVQHLREQVKELTEQVAALTTRNSKPVSQCYNCTEEGHVQRECPDRRRGQGDYRRCYNCGIGLGTLRGNVIVYLRETTKGCMRQPAGTPSIRPL